MSADSTRRVLVLVNPKSGLWWSFDQMRKAMDESWDLPGTELSYQFCQNVEDGIGKAQRAVADGVDIILVVGGDGTVNTIGRQLIGSDTVLGIIPVGSGNGFARHFDIPRSPERAVAALANATMHRIDVGYMGDTPFLVTCSMAWEAAIARSFAKSPVRGVLPYVFAGMQELFDYKPQDFEIHLDDQEPRMLKKPMVVTVANLSQYGGGARIAPQARPDDGHLELVVALRQDAPKLAANIGRLFDGSLDRLPEVQMHRFRELTVVRPEPGPIQLDGEYVDAPATVNVHVRPGALRILVPKDGHDDASLAEDEPTG